MIYIQLPKKDGLNKVGIKEFHYTEEFIIFRYFLFSNDIKGDSVMINVFNSKEVDKIKSVESKSLNCFDAFCRGLLQHLIDKKIQEGTLEVK